MKYKVKCTWCVSLLMNMGKFKTTNFCKDENDIYIEVDNKQIAIYIEFLDNAQKATYRFYNEVFNNLEK